VTWDWDFGDNTPHSTDFQPTHTYLAAGTYTVTLTMTVMVANSPVVTSTSQQITIAHWEPDIEVTICSDGHVIYETTAPAGWHNLHRERTWSFGNDAHWHEHIHRHKKKVRVCYDTPGLKIAKLYAINADHGECEAHKEVNITTVDRCCPHDKIKMDQGFAYSNKQYLLRTVFRYHGSPHGVIFAKSKLMLKKNNIWRRKRAYSIGVEFTGDVFTKGSNGCFCADGHAVHGLKAHSNRARIAKRVLPPLAGAIRVKRDGLTCNYAVKVDGNDPGQTFALSLWTHDCGCE
jgi:PKD repeat protein